MQTYKIDTNSWHYQFLLKRRRIHKDMQMDLCEYRNLLLGQIVSVAMPWFLKICCVVVVGFLAYIITFVAGMISLEDAYGPFTPWQYLFAGFFVLFKFFLTVAFGISVYCLICYFHEWFKKKRPKAYVKKQDGFVKAQYKSWKEKYCVKVEFKESDDVG